MNQTFLSDKFSKVYPEILEYTIKAIKKSGCKIEKEALLSECYIHLDRWKDQIKNENDIIAYSKTFIKNQINWQNTPVFLREVIKETGEYKDNQTSDSYIDTGKILGFIDEFERSLPLYERRIFHMYWKSNLTKAKEISNHVGCSISTSYNIIHECRRLTIRLRGFIEKKLIYL